MELHQVKQAQCSVLQAHTLSISEYGVANDDIGDEPDVDLDGVEIFRRDSAVTRHERRVRVSSKEFKRFEMFDRDFIVQLAGLYTLARTYAVFYLVATKTARK